MLALTARLGYVGMGMTFGPLPGVLVTSWRAVRLHGTGKNPMATADSILIVEGWPMLALLFLKHGYRARERR